MTSADAAYVTTKRVKQSNDVELSSLRNGFVRRFQKTLFSQVLLGIIGVNEAINITQYFTHTIRPFYQK